MKLPSSWRSNSRKTLRTVQDLALNWSASTRLSGPNSRCLIDGPLASRSGILPQGCMSPGCPAFLSPPVKAGFTVSFQPWGGGGSLANSPPRTGRCGLSFPTHPSCRVKATFTQCPAQETIRGVGWGAEAKNWGGEAVAPSHRRSSHREIIPAHGRFLGYGTSKTYPLPHFTLDVRHTPPACTGLQAGHHHQVRPRNLSLYQEYCGSVLDTPLYPWEHSLLSILAPSRRQDEMGIQARPQRCL